MPRVLLVKLGAIGDVLMAIPAAHALRAAGYEVDWLCGRAVAPILALYDWINVIEADERTLLLGSKPARLRAIFALWRTLRASAAAQPRAAGHTRAAAQPSGPAEPYALCATLYYDRRYKLLTLPIRARQKFNLSPTGRAARLIPGRHHSSEYARILVAHLPAEAAQGRGLAHLLLAALDGESPSQFAPIPIPAHRLPPSPLPAPTRPRIVLVPAGSRNLLRDDTLRRWPIELYLELASLLLDRGCEVVLGGGPGDEWASAHFAGVAVTDCIAKLSLLESLALFDSAALVVSHDTGPLHMAALTRAAIVAIFGPTDPRVFLPQRPNTIALWGGEGFACRPCYDGRNFAPCLHNGCMFQVTPALVLTQIETLLAAHRDGRELPPRIAVPPHTPLISAASLTNGAATRL